MLMPFRLVVPALLLALAAASPLARAADADPLKADHDKLQGKWKADVRMGDNDTKWTLDVKGSKATLTVENDGAVAFRGKCDFKLERHGKFRTFTYWKLGITEGDRSGETLITDGKTKSSLYKFEDGRFVTTGGFREDDDDKPQIIRWERTGR
jgi:hypothetical protein